MIEDNMATQTSRGFSWVSLGVSVLIAIGIGVGIAYYIGTMPDKPVAATQAPPPAPAEAPPPPKIDFFGAGAMAGNTSTLSKEGVKVSADLSPADAMIVWLRMDIPARTGGGQGQRGGPGGVAPATMAPMASGGGRGGGGRGPRVPLTIKDPDGRDYSFSMESKDNGIFALHLKKGYDKKPAYLTITEAAGDKTVGSWKVENVPAPKLVLPDSALTGAPIGEIQIHQGGRPGARVTASVHLTMNLPKNQGVILHPVAASYTPIEASRTPNGLVSKPGESPFNGRLNVPNPEMAHRMSFDMQTYEAVQTFEDVTFKTARIESRFGQPTLIVDQDEVAKTKSGVKVALTRQDDGPKHKPRTIHPELGIRLMCSGEEMTLRGAPGIAPGIDAEITQPTPESLGLTKLSLSFYLGAMPEGQRVFDPVTPPTRTVPAGTFKFGPTPITIRMKITYAKLVKTQRIVLPVNPKVMPPDTSGAGGGNAVMAPAPQLRVRG